MVNRHRGPSPLAHAGDAEPAGAVSVGPTGSKPCPSSTMVEAERVRGVSRSDALGLAVADGVADGLSGDSEQASPCWGRARASGSSDRDDLDVVAAAEVVGHLLQDPDERLVDRAGERGDGAAHLVERSRGGTADPFGGLGIRCLTGQRPGLAPEKGELLGQPVMQVPRHPPAVLQHGGVRPQLPVGTDLPAGADQQQEVEAQAQEVAGVDVVGVQGGEEEVVHAGRRGEDAAHRHPSEQLVVATVGPPAEGECRRCP